MIITKVRRYIATVDKKKHFNRVSIDQPLFSNAHFKCDPISLLYEELYIHRITLVEITKNGVHLLRITNFLELVNKVYYY